MSKWNDTVYQFMKLLVIASPRQIGLLMAAVGAWTAGTSSRNNASKVLRELADLKILEFVNGVYRLPGCKSEGGGHAQALTDSMVMILLAFPGSCLRRELTVSPIATRLDCLALVQRDGMGCCFGLEQINSEPEESIRIKESKWASWPEALPFLSNVLGYKIKSFQIVRSTLLQQFLGALK